MQALSSKELALSNFYLKNKLACLARDARRIARLEEPHSEAGASLAGAYTNVRTIPLPSDRAAPTSPFTGPPSPAAVPPSPIQGPTSPAAGNSSHAAATPSPHRGSPPPPDARPCQACAICSGTDPSQPGQPCTHKQAKASLQQPSDAAVAMDMSVPAGAFEEFTKYLRADASSLDRVRPSSFVKQQCLGAPQLPHRCPTGAPQVCTVVPHSYLMTSHGM